MRSVDRLWNARIVYPLRNAIESGKVTGVDAVRLPLASAKLEIHWTMNALAFTVDIENAQVHKLVYSFFGSLSAKTWI